MARNFVESDKLHPVEAPAPAGEAPVVAHHHHHAPPPPVEFFRVVVDTNIMLDKFRAKMRAGKIVDGRSYDIALLRRQGVKLAKCDEDGNDIV